MLKDRKKLTVLMSLVIFWIALIVVQRSRVSPVPESSPAKRAGRPTPTQEQVTTKKRPEVPELKLSRIERVRPPFDPEVRNIFGSITPVPPPMPPKPQTAPPPPAPDPFLEEAKTIRFLGYAEADGKAMAFVALGDEAFVVVEREVFGSKFRVKQVEEDALIVSSLDGTKEIRLGLSPGPAGALPGSATQRGNRP